jgi:DNA-binding transcriptional MerR regulator
VSIRRHDRSKSQASGKSVHKKFDYDATPLFIFNLEIVKLHIIRACMFLTGEFSKIAQISKRLLHHYDRIDLFKPAYTDPHTAYRYYSADQLQTINRILALKELGFSLDQIKVFISDNISNDEINSMLMQKKSEVEQQVASDLQRLRQIEARLELGIHATDSPDVVIKSVQAQTFLCNRSVVPTPQDMFKLVNAVTTTVPKIVPAPILGMFAAVIHSDEFRLENNDINIGYYLNHAFDKPVILPNQTKLEVHQLPPVETMASSIQLGGADLIFQALEKIALWISNNGYRINGPFREIGIDMSSPESMANSVIEIQMPVIKAN